MTILCVVDESPELRAAIRYAGLLARQQGRDVALLFALEPVDVQHWQSVEELMRQEKQQEAEVILSKWSILLEELCGRKPGQFIQEGKAASLIPVLLDTEPGIKHLVLAAAEEYNNPGPLVSMLAGSSAGNLRVPVTVVPGKLSNEQIAALFTTT